MLDRTFPTTVGFCVASGFDLPASKQPTSSPGFAAASGAVRTAPLPALNVKVPVASPLQPSYLQKQSMPVDTSVPSKSQEVFTPTNSNNLGWKGLLEISRNSGASGVLGFCKVCKATPQQATCPILDHLASCRAVFNVAFAEWG